MAGWFAVMVALAVTGPVGRKPVLAMSLYGAAFLLMAGMARSFPAKMTRRQGFGIVLAIGIAARLLFFSYPPGNDLFRYIWEGAVQAAGFNPYVYAPDHPSLAALAAGDRSAIHSRINNPSLPAIYAPVGELLFRLLYRISPSIWAFKGAMLAFEVGTLVFLSLLLERKGFHPARLLLYAANPLAILFLAGEGHIDSFQVFLLTAAVYFLAAGREGRGAFLLGAACLVKYLPAVLVPFWLLRGEGSWRKLLFLLPFSAFLRFAFEGGGVTGSLADFARKMHYNDGLMELLRASFGEAALTVAAFLLAGGMLWVWLVTDDPLRGSYLACGLLLLFLPTLHPWYLTLIAPFLCFFPHAAWVYLQAAMLFTFPVFGQEYSTGVFREVPWMKALEYLPFFALLGIGLFRRRPLGYGEEPFPAPRTLTALVPTLNEESTLGRTIGRLKSMPQVSEIRVADGGSTDATVAIARAAGAKVVTAPPGRGGQIAAASSGATGDVLWIVHADSVPLSDAAERILRTLHANPQAVGGAFGMAFDEEKPALRWIARLNNARAFLTGISFGDQGQFVRRAGLDRVGGLPDLRLMEDVELSLRLKRLGRPLYLGRGIVVSARRWKKGTVWKNLGKVVFLFFRFLLERRMRRGRVRDERYFRLYYPGR